MVKDLRTGVQTSDTGGVLDGDLDQFMAGGAGAEGVRRRAGEGRGRGVGRGILDPTTRIKADPPLDSRACGNPDPLWSCFGPAFAGTSGKAGYFAPSRLKYTSTFMPTASGPGLGQVDHDLRDIDVGEVALAARADAAGVDDRRDRGHGAGDVAAAKCRRAHHDALSDFDVAIVALVDLGADAQLREIAEHDQRQRRGRRRELAGADIHLQHGPGDRRAHDQVVERGFGAAQIEARHRELSFELARRRRGRVGLDLAQVRRGAAGAARAQSRASCVRSRALRRRRCRRVSPPRHGRRAARASITALSPLADGILVLAPFGVLAGRRRAGALAQADTAARPWRSGCAPRRPRAGSSPRRQTPCR